MKEFKTPNIVSDVTPFLHEANYQRAMRDKAEEDRKRQFRHDWRIAIFSILGGSISGFVTSLIFWLITK